MYMKNKSFNRSIEYIYKKLKDEDHFSFSKYADGEYAILRNIPITNCDNWSFIPERHEIERHYLLDSFQYNHLNYYVGISCPCCQPMDHVKWMRDNVRTENVTWANIFVNDNYSFFVDHFLPVFNNWSGSVTLVAFKDGLNKSMPFKVNNYIPLNIGSWLNPDLEKIIEISSELACKENNQLFLFSGGPLGNILAHQLHLVNKNNTYLDIGSTINPWIVGNNRGYLRNNKNKICIW